MGTFDSVWVKCPNCNTENQFQSKSGDCSLENYTLENCPEDVLQNVNRHAPIKCEKCLTYYSVNIQQRKAILTYELSKKKLGILQAYEKGYRVINGQVMYKGNTRKLYKHIKRADSNTISYYSFGIRGNDGKRIEIYVHQLLAYQKFGSKIFDSELEVRHLDGDSLNNMDSNVEVGTRSQNRRDYLERIKK